MLYIII